MTDVTDDSDEEKVVKEHDNKNLSEQGNNNPSVLHSADNSSDYTNSTDDNYVVKIEKGVDVEENNGDDKNNAICKQLTVMLCLTSLIELLG